MRDIVGVDIDDVKVGFNPVLQPWHNRMYGTNLEVEDIVTYDLWEVWGCKKSEAIRRVHEFYESPDSRLVRPLEGSQQGCFSLHREGYGLVSITSRPEIVSIQTREMVEMYFPDLFRDIYFTNGFVLGQSGLSKADVCKKVGARVMIEDAPKTALECYEAGIGVVLLNAPWNRNVGLPKEILRVDDWNGIVEGVRTLTSP